MTSSQLNNLWRTFPEHMQRHVHEIVCEFRLDPTLDSAREVWFLIGLRRCFDTKVSEGVWDVLLDKINEEISDQLRRAS